MKRLAAAWLIALAVALAQNPAGMGISGGEAIDLTLGKAWTALHTWNANGIAATPTNRIVLGNDTAATAGVPVQMPPCIEQYGYGWKTDATAASRKVQFRICTMPVQGATNPRATVRMETAVNSGTFSPFLHTTIDATALESNIFLGVDAGNYTLSPSGGGNWLASYNSGVGPSALGLLTTGYNNSAMGGAALYYVTSGFANSALGLAGWYPDNDIAQYRITTDTYMTLLGSGATKNTVAQLTNSTSLGANALVTKSNQIVLGDPAVTEVSTAGSIITTASLIGGKAANTASAATLTLPAGNVLHITGTTNIDTLNTCDAANAGRQVTLIFDGVLTVGDANNLKLAGAFVTTADDTLTVVCEGTNWYEVARSVN